MNNISVTVLALMGSVQLKLITFAVFLVEYLVQTNLSYDLSVAYVK